MTDVEKRRIKLLEDTRKMYSEKQVPPAVHPRYQSAYRSLYEEASGKTGTFGVRVFIAILLFVLVFTMHMQNKTFGSIDADLILQEIQREMLFR